MKQFDCEVQILNIIQDVIVVIVIEKKWSMLDLKF